MAEIQPPIGTERFNYDMQRHEKLLPEGWVAAVPDMCADTWPGMMRRGPVEVVLKPPAPTKEQVERMAIALFRAARPGSSAEAWMELGPVNKTRFCSMAHAALKFEHAVPDDNEIHALALAQLKQSVSVLETVTNQRDLAIRSLAQRQVMNIDLMNDRQRRADQEKGLLAEVTHLRHQLWLPTEPGDHDYLGPVEWDPETGRNVPVRDIAHERFHAAVGDVKAGRIIQSARRAMQEALKQAPKEPIEVRLGDTDDRRRMGTWAD